MLSVCQITHMFLHENTSRILISSTEDSKGAQHAADFGGFAITLGKIKSAEERYYLPEPQVKRARLGNRDRRTTCRTRPYPTDSRTAETLWGAGAAAVLTGGPAGLPTPPGPPALSPALYDPPTRGIAFPATRPSRGDPSASRGGPGGRPDGGATGARGRPGRERVCSAPAEPRHLPGFTEPPAAARPRPRLRTYPPRRLPGEVHGVDADGDGRHPLLGFPEVVGEGGHLPLGHDQNVLLEACEGQRGAVGGSPAGQGPRCRARLPPPAGGWGGWGGSGAAPLTEEDPRLPAVDPQVERVGLPRRGPQAAEAEGAAEQRGAQPPRRGHAPRTAARRRRSRRHRARPLPRGGGGRREGGGGATRGGAGAVAAGQGLPPGSPGARRERSFPRRAGRRGGRGGGRYSAPAPAAAPGWPPAPAGGTGVGPGGGCVTRTPSARGEVPRGGGGGGASPKGQVGAGGQGWLPAGPGNGGRGARPPRPSRAGPQSEGGGAGSAPGTARWGGQRAGEGKGFQLAFARRSRDQRGLWSQTPKRCRVRRDRNWLNRETRESWKNFSVQKVTFWRNPAFQRDKK